MIFNQIHKNYSRSYAKSYAKINLGLYITGKREDGYHYLSSIFLPIDLHDNISFQVEEADDPSFTITVSGPFAADCPVDESNIIYKAYLFIKEYIPENTAISVNIEKNIPAGAGLGGGSSNAATVLKELNIMLELGLSNRELKNIASKIGADVPFFIDTIPSYVEGIGDLITPFELKKDYWVLLVKPPKSLSTKEIYSKLKLDLTLFDMGAKSAIYMRKLVSEGLKRAEKLRLLSNDLEEVSKSILPEISVICDWLGRTAPVVTMMSGSGSSSFALFEGSPDNLEKYESTAPDWFLCTSKVMRGHV